MIEQIIDTSNASFWDELCGSGLARALNITDFSLLSLIHFDLAYLDIYPYLDKYVLTKNFEDKKILEIGLGYGTIGQLLAAYGCEYYGI